MMTASVNEWLKSGEYLPQPLRDFHDQKDVFKAIDEVVQRRADNYTKDVSWVSAQVYTIDLFLWLMAKHGYTLQRSRKRVEFQDLDEWVSAAKEERQSQMVSMLFGATASPTGEAV